MTAGTLMAAQWSIGCATPITQPRQIMGVALPPLGPILFKGLFKRASYPFCSRPFLRASFPFLAFFKGLISFVKGFFLREKIGEDGDQSPCGIDYFQKGNLQGLFKAFLRNSDDCSFWSPLQGFLKGIPYRYNQSEWTTWKVLTALHSFPSE